VAGCSDDDDDDDCDDSNGKGASARAKLGSKRTLYLHSRGNLDQVGWSTAGTLVTAASCECRTCQACGPDDVAKPESGSAGLAEALQPRARRGGVGGVERSLEVLFQL
jgi:hypothetical protein